MKFNHLKRKNRAGSWKLITLSSLMLAGAAYSQSAQDESKSMPAKLPNILWIFVEDLSPLFGCYGDEINQGHTEALDTLADEGILFKRAYVPAPVCSATRSAMIVGAHQVTTGTQHHRSSRASSGVVPEKRRIYLPEGMKTIPELMREAGYYTFNQGKDDYNFHYDRRALYEAGNAKSYQAGMNGWQGNRASNHKSLHTNTWASRPDSSQPWFGQVTLWGGKGDQQYCPEDELLAPDALMPPPYYPDNDIQRENWVVHYNSVRGHSYQVGKLMKKLEEDGELENTIIFYFSDHGNNKSLRHKQLCYEGGLHVPMIIVGNHPKIKAGTVVNDITSTLDIPATTLALGGVDLPAYLDGQNLFSDTYQPLEYVASARDRCDYTIDKIRTVRTDQFRFIKNYFPERPLMQPQYRDSAPAVVNLKQLHQSGKLTDYQAKHWFGERAVEELYDIEADPHQINNLANDPEYQEVMAKHRELLETWRTEIGDNEEEEETAQLKSVYELWKKKPVFKNAKVNSEYDQFK